MKHVSPSQHRFRSFLKHAWLTTALCMGALLAYSQMTVQQGGTPQSLAELISGSGVKIINPVVNCPNGAFGSFSAIDVNNFPASRGLILSTGNINDIPGANTSESTTTEWNTPGDPFLTQIAGATSFDACIFEFDVIPIGDTLRFNFTFASEEYQEYVGTVFNDVFGFFISGPGIVGQPQFGGAQNIAVIPNTTIPVTINTINNGNPSTGFPPVNPAFYFNNPLSFTSQVAYDGWTLNLFAQAVVTPCDTFHLKLAIADVGDRRWDSGVFVEAITSGEVTLTIATEDTEYPDLIEGCHSGNVTFTREPVTSDPLSVLYFIQGTATNGVDYPLIGDNPDPNVAKIITIPGGQASVSIPITPFADGVDEGIETIVFYIGNPLCPNTITDSLTVVIRDFLEVSIDPLLAFVCLGDSLTFGVSQGGTSFTWTPATGLNNPNIAEPTVTPSADAIYTLTTTVGSCVATAESDIRVTDMSLSANVTNVLCASAGTGAIGLTQTGGEEPVTYQWSGPNGFASTSQSINGLEPGTYTVVATDRYGCTATLTASVSEATPISISLVSPTFQGGFNISCAGADNGQINATITGGTPPYSLLWNDPNAQTGTTATGLTGGSYTLTVTDANGCIATGTITLTQPAPVTGTLEERTDVLCFGQSTGTATVAGQGGVAPYSYVWNSAPPQAGPAASGLPAGVYVVTITDLNGCIGNIEIEIIQPSAPLNASVAVTTPSCNATEDGLVTATVTGGTPPYSYNWTIPGAGNTPTVTNVPGGNYLLTVTDANGCTTAQPFAVSAPQPLVVTLLNQINVACFGQATGSALIGVTGGTQPYSISWNTIPPASGPIVLNLPAGTYTATVVDANGCTGSATVEITQPAAPLAINTIATNAPTCNGFNDGGIETIATGGTAPYTYTWNTVPPLNTPAVTGLAGGTYTLTVVDANGCTTTQLYDLSEPDAIAIQITNVQQVLCFGGATGSATIQASGGTAPLTIQWNDPLSQTGNTATVLTAGIYTATVTDANGCVASVQVQITQPQAPLSATIDPVQNVNCTGDATGQATVNITGGSGSYTIQWNDPAGQQTATASNLAAGTYTVTITDNNGCDVPLVLTVEITEPDDALQVQITPSLFAGGFNISCAGDSTGTLAITITGGTGPYSVLWDLPGLDTSTDLFLSDLKAGTYAVLITDANGCTAFASIALTEPDPISITFETTPSQCFGIPGGSISIQIFGGVPAYGVEWTAPDGSSAGSALQLIDIVGGSYLLTIQDANGCEYLDAVTVVQPEDIAITVDALSDFNGFNTRCSNSSDGSIEISVTGGTGTYSYQWNRPGFPNYSNQQDVFGIPAATHEVVVTDGNGCVQNLFITLTAPAPITVAFDAGLYDNGLNISCFGANDGSVEATASGGTPGYTYVWIGEGGFGPVFQNPITNLGPGEYSVLVIDANNCNFTSSVTLTGPPPFTITLQPTVNNGNNIGCAGGATGSINLITNGGAAPFTYSWTGPDGFMSSNEDLFNLPAGTYCVVVTDATFCTAQACVTLTEAPPLTLTLTPAVLPNGFNVGCGESNGSITTTVTGGTAAFTYNWTGPGNFTAFTPNISGLQAGTYCLTLTDANGCTTSECVTLSQPANVAVAINLTQPISCFGVFNGALAATVLQGEAPFSYFWTGPSGFTSLNQSISGLAPGTYCVQVTDVNGCTGNACFNLTPPPPIQVLISPSDLPGGFGVTCFGSQDGFALASVVGGTQPYQFAWTGPNGFTATTQALTQLGAGTYCLDVTDATGCAAPQACVTLAEPPAIQADPTISLPTCGDGSPAIVNLNVTQGTPPYLYLWSNGGTTASQTLGTGEYTVLITDDNGCQITEVITIEVPEVLVISLISPVVPGGVNIGCTGDATGSISLSVSGAQGNFTVSWTGPDGFSSSNQNLTNLAAGTYCATVTDDAGCEANACITLTEPLPVTATLNINDAVCADANNGSITALPSGGVPTYFISWTGPGSFTASGPTISGLAPGTYCALITDANNCTSTICGDINEPTAVNVTLDSPTTNGVNVACAGASTGSITSTPSGGTGTYTYNWTGPNGFNSTEQNPAGLSAGTYCVVVTDQNGCTAQACSTLTEADPIVVDASIFVYPNGFNVSCAGSCDGSLAVSFTGGQEPIDAQWSGPAGFTATGTTLNDLCVGTFTLTTTDGNGCVQVETITITAPPSIVLSLSSPTFGGGTEISCFGAANGTINTFISGGVPGYTFSWSGPGGFTSSVQNPDNLGPGTYTVMVTDATNCTATEQITLNEPETALTATATAATFPSGTNISCAGSNDGSITTTPVGGTPPYSYNWLGPNNFNSTNQNISGLAPGEYVLVVQDANSCVFTVEVTLTAPLTPVTATATTLTPVLCAGATTGAIQVAGEGGSGTYTVLWIGPNGFTSNAFAIENLPAGTYTYALSDENSCTVSGAVTLNEGPQLELTADVTNAQCDAANGAIAINVTNGTEPIIYAWSTGASDAAISGLPAGVYTVLVTDANGCQASGQYEVGSTNSLELVVSTTEPNCHGEMSGSIQTSVVSGAQPISFAWSGPNEFTSSEEDPFNLMAGTYSLFALDANGCITELEVTLNQPEPLEISPLVSPLYLNGFNVTTFGGSDGSINAPQVSGGTTPYDYFWTGPNGFLFEGDGALGGLSAGTYRLAVVDARLCSDTAFITLREPVPLELPNGISPNGDGFNDGLIVRGLDDFPENTLYVYNRWGNLLYEERNYRNQTPWIGTNNSGEMLPEGTYFVVVVLPNRDDLRGYLELRR